MSARQIESLESRTFLAADLSAAIESTTLADALVVGLKSKAATATINVSNSGDAVLKTTKGTILVAVGLRGEDGTIRPLGTANVKASALAKGTPVKAKVKLTPPTNLAAGSYTLVAGVAGGTVVPKDNTANNSVDGKSVAVSIANSDLAITATTTLAGSVATGTKGTVNVAVQNVGNVAAKAIGVLTIVSTVNGQASLLSTIENIKLNVKPGGTVNLKPATIAVSGVGEADVQAVISVSLVSSASGDLSGNNVAEAGTLTVTPPPPSPLDVIGVGEVMTFVKTQGASFNGTGFETGNWTDSNGRTGTYQLTTGLASDGACGLNSNGVPLAGVRFTFNNGQTKLGGTSLRFGVDPGASLGSMAVSGMTVYFNKA